MAAPTPVTRTTPTGWKMPDGYKTTIALANIPGINLWERTVKPPSIDGGDATDTTTMHNSVWRTKQPKTLKTMGESTTTVAYDPDVYSDIINQVNINQSITVRFPDNSKLTFWGYLQKFEPSDLKEGEMPEATATFVPTNWDSTLNVEAAPVFTAAAGT